MSSNIATTIKYPAVCLSSTLEQRRHRGEQDGNVQLWIHDSLYTMESYPQGELINPEEKRGGEKDKKKEKKNTIEQCHGYSDLSSHLTGLHLKGSMGTRSWTIVRD